MRNRFLDPLTIPLALFQQFEGGESIEVEAPAEWHLVVGDRIIWEYGSSHSGFAVVVEHRGDEYRGRGPAISPIVIRQEP